MSVSGSINTKNMIGFLCKTQKPPSSFESRAAVILEVRGSAVLALDSHLRAVEGIGSAKAQTLVGGGVAGAHIQPVAAADR